MYQFIIINYWHKDWCGSAEWSTHATSLFLLFLVHSFFLSWFLFFLGCKDFYSTRMGHISKISLFTLRKMPKELKPKRRHHRGIFPQLRLKGFGFGYGSRTHNFGFSSSFLLILFYLRQILKVLKDFLEDWTVRLRNRRLGRSCWGRRRARK